MVRADFDLKTIDLTRALARYVLARPPHFSPVAA